MAPVAPVQFVVNLVSTRGTSWCAKFSKVVVWKSLRLRRNPPEAVVIRKAQGQQSLKSRSSPP